jgi:hypothetical protein
MAYVYMTKVKEAVIRYSLVYIIHNYHEINELYMRVYVVSDPSELVYQSISDSDVLVFLKVSNIDGIAYFFLYVY